jgi:hypothetical protein
MNVSRPHRIPLQRAHGRVLAGGLLLGAILTGAVAAGPAAFASRSAPAAHTSAAIRSTETAGGSGVVTWSESPASSAGPDNRSLFTYASIKPGSVITDHVAVLNRSKQSVAFTIYATDATGTTLQNVLQLLPGGVKPHDIGSWVRFPGGATQLSIVIPANKGIVESFKVQVPSHATPGDHTGGMMAAVSFNRKTTKGSVVIENQRIGVPIELRVTGHLHAALQVQSISAGFHSPLSPFGTGSATIAYTVANTGNVRLTGSQTVSVTGPFGVKSTIQLKNLPTVLPGDSVRVTAQPKGLFPDGPMTAHVHLNPADPVGAPLPIVTAAAATGSASLFAVPWTLILLIIVVAGAGYGIWRARGWQRRRLRTRLEAVADKARRDTERRLLGNSGKSATEPQKQA